MTDSWYESVNVENLQVQCSVYDIKKKTHKHDFYHQVSRYQVSRFEDKIIINWFAEVLLSFSGSDIK